MKQESRCMMSKKIITKVLLQEKHYWDSELKSIVKFHLTDIHFLKNFKTNFLPT